MRALGSVVAACLIACGGAPSPAANTASTTCAAPDNPAAGPLVRKDLHCTMSTPSDEDVCRQRGPTYSLQAPLHCYGTPPGPDAREKERLAYEASSAPCACISPVEIEECSRVP